MQALLRTLAERGSLVAPDVAERLARSPELAEALLARESLPFLVTLDDLAPVAGPDPRPAPEKREDAPLPGRVFNAEDAEDAERAETEGDRGTAPPSALSPQPSAPQVPVPPPFTPDTRGLTQEALRGEASPARAPVAPSLLRPPAIPAGPVTKVASFVAGVASRPARPRLFEPYAHQVEVLADVTGKSTCEGAISDFTRCFSDRLNKIRKMLRQRREMVGFMPVAKAASGGPDVRMVGIVTEVRTTKNGHRILEIEDESGSALLLAPANENTLVLEADTVIEDEVIGVVCRPPRGSSKLFLLQHIVRPDVPLAGPNRRSPNASAVAILSDLHMGAKTFLHEDWERFIRWINLDWGDARHKALARKVKYLVVNGDIAEGVGIFPGQENELEIVDAYEQYAFAGEQFNRIRDDIRIFVLPGNHDLVRPAEPQPALPEKYKRLFPETVTHVGNPLKISVEGVELLFYHGRGMDDWITRVSGLSYENPLLTMKEMLQRRHMMPVYGLRTPIAPEHNDYLTIDTVPDVFVTGHVHGYGVEQHRGVTLINASCWQSQTSYQKMHGFTPDVGKLPVVELDTMRTLTVDFHGGRPAGVDVVGRSAFGDAFRQPEKLEDPGVVL